MLFPTVEFAIYFPVVLAISWLLMPHLQWWKLFIVGASYLFYGSANWKFCFQFVYVIQPHLRNCSS